MQQIGKQPAFELGQIVATPGALAALKKAGQQPGEFLTRHVHRELDDEDRRENEYSLDHGFRLLSAYRTNAGDRLWIITESDRSATTILLPEEYWAGQIEKRRRKEMNATMVASGTKAATPGVSSIRDIPLGKIHEYRTNPRRIFDESKLTELAENIRQHGVLQPVARASAVRWGSRHV